MAYLSEENTEMYRRMLSADDERGPVQSGLFNPPPRTAAPTPAMVVTKRGVGKPIGAMAVKGITITGTSGKGIGGGTSEITVKQAPLELTGVQPGGFPSVNRLNFMPLVYIGGAGLLLYFLFKK